MSDNGNLAYCWCGKDRFDAHEHTSYEFYASGRVAELERTLDASYAALATSQADVTRLAAELAESVRALAVSQGEVERLDGELDAKHAKLVEVADKLRAVRGDLERARGLLGEFELSDEIDNSGDKDGAPTEPWWMCLHCGGPMDECDLIGTCLGARVRAFLAPPPPPPAPSPTGPAPE